jgi:hypothetical protein
VTARQINILHKEFWSRVSYGTDAQPHAKPAPLVMTEDPRAWRVTGVAANGRSKSK